MTGAPLVSVGLSVFNGANGLAAAIRSLLAQTYPGIEILVVDDGSTDASVAIASAFTDPRVRVVVDGERRGLAARLNQAVQLAQGKYFARMDHDDLAFPERLAKQVSFLEAHPEVDLVAAGALVFTSDGRAVGKIPVKRTHEAICARPWAGFYLPHPTWMGRRDWFARHGYDNRFNGAEDQHLLFRTWRTSRFACLDETLLAYREDRRTLRKMLARRYAFLRAIGSAALASNDFNALGRCLAMQCLKVAGDVLNIGFGWQRARNPLQELDSDTRQSWSRLWTATGGAG